MKFGEYLPGDIFEYPLVLAGENSVTRCVKTNRVRAKIFDGLIYMIMLLFSKQKKMMIMMMMMIENIVCIIFQIFCIVGEQTNSFFFTAGDVLFGVFSGTAL